MKTEEIKQQLISAIKKEFPLTEILFLWLVRLLSKID